MWPYVTSNFLLGGEICLVESCGNEARTAQRLWISLAALSHARLHPIVSSPVLGIHLKATFSHPRFFLRCLGACCRQAMSSCQLSTRHWEIDGPGGFHRQVRRVGGCCVPGHEGHVTFDWTFGRGQQRHPDAFGVVRCDGAVGLG